jgi:hypothetical protein
VAILASGASAQDELAGKARAILNTHCSACHGQAGKGKGGFDYVLRRDLLVARGQILPGKPADSELYRRVQSGDMPPPKAKDHLPPSKDGIALLEKWIAAGAPDWQTAATRELLSESDVHRAIRGDLEALPSQQRTFFRYFSLANLANAGHSDDDLNPTRLGLAKLLNSLSLHPRLTVPHAIDGTHAVYRIDLRDYKWNARLWEKIVAVYPYRTGNSGADARKCAELTGSEQPYVRADWFIATASRPPLYYDLLQMPATDKGLERFLQLDAAVNIEEQSVLRAGFNGSGVSKNNRLIERHDAAFGAYWKTYDFAENVDKQNLFDRPLGPPPARNSFVHNGGEMIFHLPNGMLGFFLANGKGQRIERAPVEIVSDPQRPDKNVEAGLSCFSCHAAGLVPKADQVRAHVLKNAQAFAKEDVETVKALYPPEAKLRALLDQDSKRYVQALEKLGIKAGANEQINAVTLRYEAVVDLATAAAEAGMKPAEFGERLGRFTSLSRSLGALRAQGGTVQREAFIAAFADLVKEFRLGDGPPAAPIASGPFAGHSEPILAVAISADGKHALSGGEDRTMRLWEVSSGRELQRFEGHQAAVAGVAFSLDGRRAVSASHDRTLRLWDVESGKELRRLIGHTDKVASVAFSADGRRLLSAGQDRTIRLWDADTGQELAAFIGHTGKISAVAFSPDSKLGLSASHDGTVRIWDLGGGEAIRVLRGHAGEVLSAAFSPDGKAIVGGGNDKTVRLWSAESGQELRRLEGHANAVIRVAFAADGKTILSGSSQYQNADRTIRLWDMASGKELRSFGGGDSDRISCVAFSADGKVALTDGPQPVLRVWKVEK